MNYNDLAKKMLDYVGGKDNIDSFTNCMTRLRINVFDQSKVDYKAIKGTEGVLGVVEGDQVQIILGPGHAERTKKSLADIVGSDLESTSVERDIAKETKDKVKSKQQSAPQRALKHIGNIFVPVIPGFIACGLILAIVNVVKSINPDVVQNPWFMLFAGMGGLTGSVLNIVVGMNSAKEFGGSPILGAIAGAFITMPSLNGIAAVGEAAAKPLNVLGIFQLQSGLGGVLGVIIAAFVFAYIEKNLRKVVPAALDLFLVPFLTLLIGGAITAFIVMPIAAAVMKFMTWLLVDIALQKGGILGGFLLSSLFLPLVMLGIHQGLTPIHAQLIQDVGYTVLLPILALAGAGQVGSSIAVYLKTKDESLKKTITAGLPIGILGIGEPLIYGVSLPLGKPFLTACLGAGVGGAYLAAVGGVGATALGVSGVLLIPLIAEGRAIHFVISLLIAYVAGAVLTYLFGYSDDLLDRLK